MLNQRNQGFSLVEVMVALAILTVATTTLLVIRTDAVRNYSRAIELRRASILLEEKMAEIARGMETKTRGSFSHKDYENYTWRAKIDLIQIPRPFEKKTPGPPKQILLREITLTVEHEDAISESITGYFLAERSEIDKSEK